MGVEAPVEMGFDMKSKETKMTVQPPQPAAAKVYRYQTGLEMVKKIVNKTKKPAEGLVPLASRPIAAFGVNRMNDILNQPDVGDMDEATYCSDWYFGCPFCFKYQEGDPEVSRVER